MGWEDLVIPSIPTYHHSSLLPDLTNEVINEICEIPEKGVMDWMPIIIYGKPGSGKTFMEIALVERMVRKLGIDMVNALRSSSYDALFSNIGTDGNGGIAKKPFQVLVVDDPLKHQLTYSGVSSDIKKIIGQYNELRHITKEKIGSKTGKVIAIAGPQVLKGYVKALRDAYIQIFLTSMGAEEKKNIVELLNGNEIAYNALLYLEDMKRKNRYFKSVGVCKLGASRVGLVNLSEYQVDYINKIPLVIATKEQTQIEADQLVERFLPHFKNIEHINLDNADRSKDVIKAEIKELYDSKTISYEEREALYKNLNSLIWPKLSSEHQKAKAERDKKTEDRLINEELNRPNEGEEFQTYAVRMVTETMGYNYGKALDMTFDGINQSQIAEELSITQSGVSRLLKEIDERTKGYLYENWVCFKAGINSTAGNTNKSDYEKDKDIRSLKCRRQPRSVTINPAVDCKPEIERALALGVPFRVQLLNIQWKSNKGHYEQITDTIDPKNLPQMITFFDKGKIKMYYSK